MLIHFNSINEMQEYNFHYVLEGAYQRTAIPMQAQTQKKKPLVFLNIESMIFCCSTIIFIWKKKR